MKTKDGMVAGTAAAVALAVSAGQVAAPNHEVQCEDQQSLSCYPADHHTENQEPMPRGPQARAAATSGPTGPTGPVPRFITGSGGLVAGASGLEGNGTVFSSSPL